MTLAPGDIFEKRYEVREELGSNEFSVVYRATSTDTGRDVAVRVVLPPAGGYPDEFDAKFIAECKRVSKLRHAGTVHLDGYGSAEDGTLYLVTEFVSGSTLADVMADEEVPARDVIGLIKRLAESLGEAHGRGVVHRELKPENIAIPLRRGVLGAKLRDYGITKHLEQDGPLSAATMQPNSQRYMSPEQILGEEVGASSNIYSLGLVMYELLARKPAVESDTPREILATHLSTTPFDIPSTVPPQLRRLLKKMVAKSKVDRFQSSEELLDAVSELDYSKLSLSAQMKVAKMVAKLKAADDDGGDAGDTVVGFSNFLESDSEVKTAERMREPSQSDDPTEAVEDDEPTDRGEEDATMRGEEDATMRGDDSEMTPTNVVISNDDVTQISNDEAPRSIGDAPQNEPTDELQDKTKPHVRRSRDTQEEERPRSSRSSRRDGERSRRGRSKSRRSRRSGERDRDRDRSRRRRDRDRDGKRRKKRRKSEPEPDEDRVSWTMAIGAMVLAVVVALLLTGGFLWLRAWLSEEPSLPPQVVTPSKPIEVDAGPVAQDVIPSVTMDLGMAQLMDIGAVPTGCGNPQPAGWTTKKKVVGLRELRYDAYVPEGYVGDPVPLIFAVHPPGPPGMFGKKWTTHVRLQKVADALGAVMIAPEDRSIRPWMTDLKSSFSDFDHVLNHATATFCVDLTQVIGVGMSTGAQALDRFSCEHPDRFAALGLVAHWHAPDFQCKGRRPATIVVNGMMDRVSPPEGGGGCFGRNLRLSLEEAEAKWRKQHGCSSPTTWADETDGTCSGFSTCETSSLVLCRVPDGVHGWPGSQISVVRCMEEFGDVPNLTQFPATNVLQRFFEQELK